MNGQRKMVRWPSVVGYCRFFSAIPGVAAYVESICGGKVCRLTFVIHGWFRKIHCGLAIGLGGGDLATWTAFLNGCYEEMGENGKSVTKEQDCLGTG